MNIQKVLYKLSKMFHGSISAFCSHEWWSSIFGYTYLFRHYLFRQFVRLEMCIDKLFREKNISQNMYLYFFYCISNEKRNGNNSKHVLLQRFTKGEYQYKDAVCSFPFSSFNPKQLIINNRKKYFYEMFLFIKNL